jgi:hypothetical protein
LNAILAPEAAISTKDQLRQFAVNAALYHYDTQLIAGELARLVPHLHPVDALARFGALRDSCEGWMKITALANGDDPMIADAAHAALDHRFGLVEHALDQMFTATTAFNDDGTPWAASVVETVTAVAA